jgi:hypothetical protein
VSGSEHDGVKVMGRHGRSSRESDHDQLQVMGRHGGSQWVTEMATFICKLSRNAKHHYRVFAVELAADALATFTVPGAVGEDLLSASLLDDSHCGDAGAEVARGDGAEGGGMDEDGVGMEAALAALSEEDEGVLINASVATHPPFPLPSSPFLSPTLFLTPSLPPSPFPLPPSPFPLPPPLSPSLPLPPSVPPSLPTHSPSLLFLFDFPPSLPGLLSFFLSFRSTQIQSINGSTRPLIDSILYRRRTC